MSKYLIDLLLMQSMFQGRIQATLEKNPGIVQPPLPRTPRALPITFFSLPTIRGEGGGATNK